ncbi:MAG TPA: YHS domain protein, partial [Puia sp.]|nr:YHS domain protein [Puia sp.]
MKIWFSFLMLLFVIPGFSQSDVFRTKQFNLDDGVAIKGYDPVSYFTMNKAVKGKKEYSISYLGVNYHFSTSADRDAFQTNPSKY